jgi:heme exporter protein A
MGFGGRAVITNLACESLAVARGGRTLFTGLSFAVAAGEAIALTGANGSGKTSLLRTIAGLIRPEGGAVVFGAEGGPLEAEEARAGGLHLLGHQDGLKPTRTAAEELAFQAGWTGAAPAAVEAAVETLDLKPLLALETRKLSAGQRRRLALGRLLASPRALWLLDEPLAPLDAHWRDRFGRLMGIHLNAGGLIVAAVHDPLPFSARDLGL